MINEVLTGTMSSATTTAGGLSADVVIEPGGHGDIRFEMQVTNGEWQTLISRPGIYVINTPDDTISYRFSCTSYEGSSRVYMGP